MNQGKCSVPWSGFFPPLGFYLKVASGPRRVLPLLNFLLLRMAWSDHPVFIADTVITKEQTGI